MISIHALLAESDSSTGSAKNCSSGFLSTLSLRRATTLTGANTIKPESFLSTLSLRRATGCVAICNRHSPISIHALLAESDFLQSNRQLHNFNFYPRSPCGERPAGYHSRADRPHFYPRSPCGERLEEVEKLSRVTVISIHALLAESDTSRLYKILCNWDFYPRSPCGERPFGRRWAAWYCLFLSTLSLRRATDQNWASSSGPLFLSTLSLRRATSFTVISWPPRLNFYPRSPCGERPYPLGVLGRRL